MRTAELLSIPLAICPERTAVAFEGQRFSYADLEERTNRFAHALMGLGIGTGDRVAMLQVNCHQYIEAYFGAAKVGAIFVPLNFRAKADELTYMLNSAEAKLLLFGDRYADLVQTIRPGLQSVASYIAVESPQKEALHYEALIQGSAPSEVSSPAQDEDTTILLYTAGTTGFPKGVMLSHSSFTLYVLENVNPADPLREEANLLVIPLYHVAGIQGMFSSLYGGRTLIVQRQFEAGAWLQAVQAERITHSVVVPTMLKQIIEHQDFSRHDLRSLQQITYGAASMPLEVISRAVELLPWVRFINAFGQTETASTVTALGPEDHIIAGTPQEKEKKLRRLAHSIGKALPGTEVKVFDEEGHELPPGQVGEIVARGPRTMSGYWRQPEATAATLRDGWVYTGDLGWMDEEGYFYLAGRAKDMIIRGGENIAPEEVEGVLRAHPAIEEAAVIAVPDVEWGEAVRAIVVLKPGHSATAEEIIEFCRQRLASFKKPESVVFAEALPRNALGKVLKTELRERFGGAEQAV